MANKLKVKRGTNLSNITTAPEAGELIYKSDTNKLYVGDGSTAANALTAIGGTGTVDTSGSPIAQEYARFTDNNTIEGRSAAGVRTDLGLNIGTNVQAYDTLLQNIADFPTSSSSNDGKVVTYQDLDGTLVLSTPSVGTITGVTGMTDNNVLTASGSTTISGESELTYNGAGLLQINRSGSNAILQLRSDTNNTRIHFKEGSSVKWNVGYDAANNKFSFYDDATVFAIEDGAGANTLIVDSNSRVGIGTASPVNKVHILGDANNAALRVQRGDNTGQNLYFRGYQMYNAGNHLLVSAADTKELRFGHISSTAQLVLDSSGNISTGVWQGTAIGLAYGGTGATSATGARSNLGLGTGATLNTAAVSDGATTLATGNAIYDHVTSRISGLATTASLGDLAFVDDIPASKVVSGTIPSARLDADTAHLSGTQTFSGAKTFSTDIVSNGVEVGTAYGSDNQYLGIKRSGAGANDYLIMQGSGGDAGSTYIGAGSGKNVNIRPNANSTTNQLVVSNSGSTIGGNTVWHAGNDGSGSTLDADLLDGLHGSSYWTKGGSWVGDLASNGYTRIQGVSNGGGEFVLALKNGQLNTLVDGSYFAYEGNTAAGGGFWSSYNSAYGNASGFKASATDKIRVQQLDGGTADLEVTGNIKLTNEKGLLWDYTPGISLGGYIAHPGGGMFRNSSGTNTGALTITLPSGGGPADMVSFWVDIFDYTSYKSQSFYIAGYVYQTAGSNEWINETAMMLTPRENHARTVRFGHDGTNHVVYIGELTDTWSYPQVTVRNVQVGYVSDVDTYNDNWDISFEASAFQNVDATFSGADTLPTAGKIKMKDGAGKFVHNTTSSRDKIRVWNSSNYAIGMEHSNNYGGLANQYAMTFNMDNTANRGFLWVKDAHSKSQGAMSLTTDGKLTVAHSMRLGYGESDTTTPGTTKLEIGGAPDGRTITFDQSGRINGLGSYFSSNATDSQLWFHVSDGGTNGDTNIAMRVYADGRLKLRNTDGIDLQVAKATRMGYSASYKALVIGETSGTYTTAFGYDPSTNASASFTGDGRELIFRNGAEFTTPNAANNGFHNDILVLKDGNVGIGSATPGAKFTVLKDGTQASSVSTTYQIQTVSNSNGGIAIQAGASSHAYLVFGDNGDYDAGRIGYENANHNLKFFTNNAEKMRITSAGNVGIGEISIDANLHITGSPCVIKQERAGVYAMRMGIPSNSTNWVLAHTDNLQSSVAMSINGSRDIYIPESVGIGVAANGTAGRLDCSNDVVAFASSDKRLKENIKPLDNALDKINKINGVEFDWKKLTEKEKETIHGNKGHDVGVIAQEIEEVLPEVVTTRDNGYKAVKYEKIVPLLIEAIKEQQVQIDELKTKIGEQNG